MSAFSPISAATTPPAGSGLVAAYGFNTGSGTTATDQSGLGNNGTLVNATWSSTGRYGAALTFDGSARVDVADAPALRLTTGMTLEAWVYPTAGGLDWRDIIFKGDDNYYLMASSSAARPVAGVRAPSYAEAYGVSALLLNTWTHLAATYDGANVRLFVNGTLVATVARAGSIITSSNPLQFGGDSIYGQNFRGSIDEIRIYNRALTAEELQADMNTPL